MVTMVDTLLLVLFVSSLGSSIQQATSQDVEIRAPNAAEAQADLDGSASSTGGGQSRTIYSQRHLSPHRMMHFGKRPAEPLVPIISAPVVASYYDVEPVSALVDPWAPRQAFMQQRRQKALVAANHLPFQFSIELENGQRLRAVPEDTILQAQSDPAKNLLYNYIGRLPADQLTFAAAAAAAAAQAINADDGLVKREQQLLLRQLAGQRQQDSDIGQRLSKLMADDGSNEEVSGGDSSSSAERAQDTSGAGQQQANAISISTRSMHPSSRSNVLSLPKAYVSTLMYGRQGSSSLPNFGAYNKKAEPKENFFMHFGRK